MQVATPGRAHVGDHTPRLPAALDRRLRELCAGTTDHVVLTVTAGTAEPAPPDTGGLPALRLAVAAGGGALPGSDAVVADPEGASPAATGCREGGGCRRPPRRRDASARGGGYVPWVGSRRSHTP